MFKHQPFAMNTAPRLLKRLLRRSPASMLLPFIVGTATIAVLAPASVAQRLTDSPPASATSIRSNRSILDEITTLFGRDEPPLGSRGSLCLVTPSLVRNADLWSDRPLFIWQGTNGTVDQITVRDFDTDAVIWQQALNPSDRAVVYGGAPLPPRQLATWELSSGGSALLSSTFELMTPGDRYYIQTGLDELEESLKASGASSQTILLEQARYFAEHGLWSDVIQVLYGIRNSSPEVTTTLQTITHEICAQ